MLNPLTLHAFDDWKSSCVLLQDSLTRYKPYDRHKKYSPQDLEFYDSLSFRYTKSIEAAFYFFRSLEIEMTGQSGEFLRDQLLKMEKLNIIEDTDEWMEARKLRNKITHAYEPDELEEIFIKLTRYAQDILEALACAQKRIQSR